MNDGTDSSWNAGNVCQKFKEQRTARYGIQFSDSSARLQCGLVVFLAPTNQLQKKEGAGHQALAVSSCFLLRKAPGLLPVGGRLVGWFRAAKP